MLEMSDTLKHAFLEKNAEAEEVEAVILKERIDIQRSEILHICAQLDRVDVFERLLPYRLDLDTTNTKQETPLHVAAKCSSDAMLRKLIRYSANLNLINQNNRTPLEEAVVNGNVTGVNTLLHAGATQDFLRNDLLEFTFKKAIKNTIVDFLFLFSLIQFFTLQRNYPVFIFFLTVFVLLSAYIKFYFFHNKTEQEQKHAEILLLGKRNTPLIVAAYALCNGDETKKQNFNTIFQALLSHQGNIHVLDSNGFSLLHLLVSSDAIENIKLILLKKVNVYVKTPNQKFSAFDIARLSHAQLTINYLCQNIAKAFQFENQSLGVNVATEISTLIWLFLREDERNSFLEVLKLPTRQLRFSVDQKEGISLRHRFFLLQRTPVNVDLSKLFCFKKASDTVFELPSLPIELWKQIIFLYFLNTYPGRVKQLYQYMSRDSFNDETQKKFNFFIDSISSVHHEHSVLKVESLDLNGSEVKAFNDFLKVLNTGIIPLIEQSTTFTKYIKVRSAYQHGN